MKGQILDYSIQTNLGIITADDQKRYEFTGAEWRGENTPKRGDHVDFDINSEGKAVQVYTALSSSNPIYNLSEQLDKISNQDQAESQFNMIDWFVKCLKNYANFTGRARRKEFCFFTLVQFIILIIAQIIDSVIGTEFVLYALIVLALLIPSLAVSVRRLHDLSKSGWWYLIAFIPLIGAIILIIWFATETKAEVNQWGQPAK